MADYCGKVPDHFFDFLAISVARAPDRGVREADLYTALKSYCVQRGHAPPSWQEFHQLRKAVALVIVPANRTMILRGIGWVKGSEFRPAGAANYRFGAVESLDATQPSGNKQPSDHQGDRPKSIDGPAPWE